MPPFTFRLAGVLAIWQRREESTLALLQWESTKTFESRAAKARLDKTRADARLEADRALADAGVGHDPAWHRNWIVRLAVDIEAARERVVLGEIREDKARAVWQRARRDRRVIERLQDRARDRHAVEARQSETRELDELAGRQVMGGGGWLGQLGRTD